MQGIIPNFLAKYSPPNTDADSLLKARQCLVSLNNCWQELQSSVDDSDARLAKALEFSNRYSDTLSNLSGWLDNIQLRLLNSNHELDIPKALQEIEVCIFVVEGVFFN